MTRKQTKFAAALKGHTPPRTSDLYGWLRSRHREVAALINRRTRDWTKIATEVSAEGVVGANGRPASPDALRKMWSRVDRDVQQEQAERMAKRVAWKIPNRSPRQTAGRHEVAPETHRASAPVRAPEAAHHPQLAAAQTVASEQGAPAPARSGRITVEDLTPEAKAQLDKVRKGLIEWDRRRHGT